MLQLVPLATVFRLVVVAAGPWPVRGAVPISFRLLYNVWRGGFESSGGRGKQRTMSDRGVLFLFSLLMILASLGAAAWLLVTGQAGTVDGLFLLLTALLNAAVFGLYVKFVIGRAMEAQKKAQAPAPASAAAKAAKQTAAPVA